MGKTYKLNQTGPTIQDVLDKIEPTLSKGDITTSDEVVHKGTSSSTGIAETIWGDKTFANYIKLQQGGPEAGSKPVKIFGDGLSSQFMVEGKTLTLFDIDNISNITMYDFDSGKIEKRWKTSYGYDNSYLLLPNSKGTSTSPATLATTEDCGTKLYKHTFSHIASEGPTLDYIITATSTPYDFTGTQGPISQIGKDALKIVTSGAITLGLSQTDEFKGQIAVITGYTITSYNLIFNSGGTTIDTVSPL